MPLLVGSAQVLPPLQIKGNEANDAGVGQHFLAFYIQYIFLLPSVFLFPSYFIF